MADTTTKLNLPFILPSQAQKHVTHNEALLTLDALVHLAILAEISTPPVSPTEGVVFLIGTEPFGPWAGRQGQLAAWQDGAWAFLQPQDGWRAWFVSDLSLKVFSGGDWRNALPAEAEFSRLGIAASADETNRLALSSPSSLFSHAGAGHQLKINKATGGDTASLLFQSGWTGYAELGLTGDNALSLKVSDGSTWRTGLSIDPAGRVHRPNQPVARAYRAGTTFAPADNTRSGFTGFSLVQGGFQLASAVPGGGNEILVPAAGIYLICLHVAVATSSGHTTGLRVNDTSDLLTLPGSAGFQSASTMAALVAGDTLTLRHDGTAQLRAGPDGTTLSLALL
ncbi:MAG: DUF2793 domain-containing protein [Pseudorhizobium pelagicum]|uniref:DUF2793 domain-containing protein n=1 Tax=Pseudorhizobium pelagicum TaxID=1509405 RepID=UPI003460423C